ncbi:uncharacterized protein LOC109407604 isoform X5 [Aedes albopictus]|uniref:C2H2-type domain-containing protein n=1 Tax=Aedes albopictus TaxID=7160 RepID=A0ABM1ZRU0_AEDAL
MYGCPHCYRIVKNKPAFEKHVNACKKKKYSCELCEFRSNELNLLDKHKEARHPKEYNQEENEVAKAEAMDTVEGEEDKTDLKTEISVEESKVNSPVREDHLDTKTESDGSCELPDSKVVTINMEFTAEETKLSKLTDKRLVVLLDNSLGEAFRKGLANNENRRLHDDASVTEASTPETSSPSELIPTGISSNQESEEMDVNMSSSETNIPEVKIKNEPIISDELLGGSENGNDQDAQPLDNDHTSAEVDEVAEADADVQNQDKPFPCPFCERAFHSMPARKHHRVTVHRDQYECAHCARKYPYKCRLLKHLKVHFESLQSDSDKKTKKSSKKPVTPAVQIKCPHCFRPFLEGKNYDHHIYHCGPRDCDICDRKFSRYHQLTYHVKKFHRELKLRCPHCPKIFIDKSDLTRHATSCAKRKYRCEICGIKFKDSSSKQHHKSTRHRAESASESTRPRAAKLLLEDTNIDIKTEIVLEDTTLQPPDGPQTIRKGPNRCFPCPICKKVYASQSAMQSHKHVHMLPRFKCPECDEWFHIRSLLLKHRRTHHRNIPLKATDPTANEPQKCPICEVEFPNLYRLNDHVKIVHTERRFKCTLCPKGFNQKKPYLRHLQFHEKEQQLESQIDPAKIRLCTVCSLPFSSIERRRRHMLTVHGEPQFPCAKCDRPFYFKSELKRHELIHLKHELGYLPPQEKKPLDPMRSVTCYQCNRQFPNRKIRHHHTLTAHGEPKYKCASCPKRFFYSFALSRHQKVHERVKKFEKCKICAEQFNSKVKKWYHMMEVHKVARYRCTECPEIFVYAIKMRRHLQSHHGKQMVRSQYRRRIITDESPKVDDSLHTEQTESRFQCTYCPKTFCHNRSRLHHERSVHGVGSNRSIDPHAKQHAEPAFPCSHCPKKFSHNRSRLHHERKVHNAGPSTPRESNNTSPTADSEPPPPSTSPTDVAEPSESSAEPSKSYECSYCQKPFFRKHSLQRHESTVHRASRIEQPNVSATPAKQNSEQPIEETSNTPSSKPPETSFQCSLCPKMFSHKHYLQRHEVAMHNAPPPPIIDQDSTNASATSTEESSSQPTGKDSTTSSTTPVQSSYKCSRCPKMFSHQHYLLRHEQLMHGVPPAAIGAESIAASPAGSEPRSVSVASNEESSVQLAGKTPVPPSPQQAPSSFPCSICPKAFTFKHNLDRHVKTIHGEPQLLPEPLIAPSTLNTKPAETLFRCSLCPKMFSHEHYLQRHANLVHGGAPIIGQEPAALASPAGSEPSSAPPATGGNPIEPSTKSVESLFHCSLCPKMFSHEHFLLRHTQVMHNASPIGQESNNASATSSEPPVASAAIKKESDARPIVEIPIESMPAKTTFKCSRCPKMFSGEHFLLRHEQLVHNAISIKQEPTSPSATSSELPSTPRGFTEENNAQSTGESSIDPSPKSSDLTYQCSICQKLFCRKYSLQRHESTVHRTPQTLTEENTAVRIKIEPGIASPLTAGENPTTPSAPPVRQQSRSATPSGSEPRSVSATSATEQTSAQPDDDELQNASLTGEESAQSKVLRPHICKDCGEQFSTSRENYYHMVEKHRDSLFQCPECPSAFILQQSLDRHKQTHKKRPVADAEETCSKCGLEFSSKEEKLKHMTDEHGENLFKCSRCPKVFSHKNSLVRHEKLPHSEQDYLANSIDPTLKIKEEPKETDEERSEEIKNADEDKMDENETNENKVDENKAKVDESKSEDIKTDGANDDAKMAIKTEAMDVSVNLPDPTDSTLSSEGNKTEVQADITEPVEKRCEETKADQSETKENKVDENEAKVDESKSEHIETVEANIDEKMAIKTEEMQISDTIPEENVTEDSKVDGTKPDESLTETKADEMDISEVTDSAEVQMDADEESSFQNEEPSSEQDAERLKASSMKSCNICGHHFYTIGKREHHMLTAHSEPKFHCPMCSKPFFYSYHLSRHLRSHKNKTIPPDGKKVLSIKRKHIRKDANSSKTDANTADEKETDESKNESVEIEDGETEADVSRNEANKEDNEANEKGMEEGNTTGSSANSSLLHSHPCTICGRQFDTVGKKEHHMLTTHTKPKFHCPMCSKPFFYRNHLRRHLKSHENQTVPPEGKKVSNSNKRKLESADENKSKLVKTDSITANENKNDESKTDGNKVDGSVSINYVGRKAANGTANEKRMEENKTTGSSAYETSHLQPCSICGYVLKTPSQKSHHMVVAHSEPAFVCTVCTKPFFYIHHLERHLANHRKNGTDRGNAAGLNNDESETKENKANNVERGVEHTAVECKKNDFEADASQLQFHSPIVQTCVHCGLQFNTSRENYYHMVESHREYLFQCSLCPSAFYLEQSLIQHKRTHRKNKSAAIKKIPPETKKEVITFKCSQCPKSFDSMENLRKHETRHQIAKVQAVVETLRMATIPPQETKKEVPTFKCGECPKAFNSKENRRKHEKRHELAKERAILESQGKETKLAPFQCSECPKTFGTKDNRRKHEKRHQAARDMAATLKSTPVDRSRPPETKGRYKCERCGLGFPTPRRKRYHIIVAHGDPLHKCAYCPKVFYFKTCLNRHHLTHTQKTDG